MGKRARKGGAEYDAFSRWRHVLLWRPSERARIKRKARRRERRQARQRDYGSES